MKTVLLFLLLLLKLLSPAYAIIPFYPVITDVENPELSFNGKPITLVMGGHCYEITQVKHMPWVCCETE